MKITSKEQMYAMLARGEFGNMLPQFFSYDDWEPTGIAMKGQTRWGIRSLRVAGLFSPFVKGSDVRTVLDTYYPPGTYNISEMIPNDWRLMSGEIVNDSLMYSTLPLPNRQAFAERLEHAELTKSRMLIRRYMDADSVDTLLELQERFPDAVVEFTCLDRPYGTMNRNTLFWEVRHY